LVDGGALNVSDKDEKGLKLRDAETFA